ncbi:MAG: DUF3108 domain-containing protein [Pseudomonadota bacterium]
MARSGKLICAISLAVLLAHLGALQWLDAQWVRPSVLKPLATPMMTRLLTQKAPDAAPAPAAVAALPRPPAPRSVAAVSVPQDTTPTLPEPVAQAVAQASAQPQASIPERTATITTAAVLPPAVPASAPAASATPAVTSTQAWLDAWPADTRLTYKLGGNFRGPLTGDARVQWLRAGERYEVKIDINISMLVGMVMTSQGKVMQQGLFPQAYEELRGSRRALVLGDAEVQFANGNKAPRPAGVQDTASQFVELTQMFASGRAQLQTGKAVSFWMARPGAVDFWTYDITGKVTLDTPELGPVEAFHLKPRPLANPRGNITAEMWFAPTLQYLPVRIRINMGEDTWVDMLVEKIEQR